MTMDKSQRNSVAWAINRLTDGLAENDDLETCAADARTELSNLLDNDE